MCQDSYISVSERTIDNVTDNAFRQELDAAVQAFGEARAGGDVAALTKLLSPTYTHTHAHTHADVWVRHQNCDARLAYAAGRRGETTHIRGNTARGSRVRSNAASNASGGFRSRRRMVNNLVSAPVCGWT
jgi:hypothetical protein